LRFFDFFADLDHCGQAPSFSRRECARVCLRGPRFPRKRGGWSAAWRIRSAPCGAGALWRRAQRPAALHLGVFAAPAALSTGTTRRTGRQLAPGGGS
jgi:hypothetical protein